MRIAPSPLLILTALSLAALGVAAAPSAALYQPWARVAASTTPLVAPPNGPVVWSPVTLCVTEEGEGKYQLWPTVNGWAGRIWFDTGHGVLWSFPLCSACPVVDYIPAGGVAGHFDHLRVGIQSTDPVVPATLLEWQIAVGQ